jgi:hypothetical protein
MSNIKFEHVLILENTRIDPILFHRIENINITEKDIKNKVVKFKELNIIIKFIIIDEDIKNIDMLLAEEKINKKFDHDHFISFIGIIDVFDEIKDNNYIGLIMPIYQSLNDYLKSYYEIDNNVLLDNILGILDLSIKLRDEYKYIHGDVKIDNIVLKNNKFCLIDWEDAFDSSYNYMHKYRPLDGNTEMYPFYDCTSEEFFIYSIGVLIVRIIGYSYNVTYKDFMLNFSIEYILSGIPEYKYKFFEKIIVNIFNRKYHKIEDLKDEMNKLL